MTLDIMLLKYIVNHKNTLLCTCALYKLEIYLLKEANHVLAVGPGDSAGLARVFGPLEG